MTLDEIYLYVEAREKQLEAETKTKLMMLYELGELIGNRVALLFDKDKKVEIMTLEKVHPELFEGIEVEQSEEEKIRIGQQQAETRKAFQERYGAILRQRKHNEPSQDTSGNRSENEGAETAT